MDEDLTWIRRWFLAILGSITVEAVTRYPSCHDYASC